MREFQNAFSCFDEVDSVLVIMMLVDTLKRLLLLLATALFKHLHE